MWRRSYKRVFIHCCLQALVIAVFAVAAKAQAVVSSFNNRALDSVLQQYSFIVTGHLHGASTNASGFPASTLLANLDTINNSGARFLVSLGDLFLKIDEQTISNYDRSFFSKLEMPMFNAVGNHDVSGSFYEKRFGKTYFSFTYGSSIFIILDSEENDGSIKNEQLKFFQDQLAIAQKSSDIKNVLIFAHRPLWAENDPVYSKLFTDNTQTAIGNNNYDKDIYPLVQYTSSLKPVYWFSGSMGGKASASFFYDRKENITYIATAIRDLPRDAVLLVNVSGDKISFKGMSLTGRELEPVEQYGLEFWQEKGDKEQPFNYRLIPYLTLQMLKHSYFWFGFCFAMLLIVLASWLVIRRKRRHAAKAS